MGKGEQGSGKGDEWKGEEKVDKGEKETEGEWVQKRETDHGLSSYLTSKLGQSILTSND
jgi:hypothetical protein